MVYLQTWLKRQKMTLSTNKGGGHLKDELERTMRMNYLYDFYHALLTDKQRKYIELYYLEDYALTEIAETLDVTR